MTQLKVIPLTRGPEDDKYVRKADAQTRRLDLLNTPYKRVFVYDDVEVLVIRKPTKKHIIVMPPATPSFWCVPVRRPELRRGIVSVTPPSPPPEAFSADARELVKNFEPLTAAKKAGYTLSPRFSTDQNENVTRLTAAYDSMKHPGDTSWHSADGKTVLSWWSGGRYATSSQVWFGIESEEWAHPVTWEAVNAAARPEAELTAALDGTLPYAYSPDGYAGATYAGNRAVPPQALHGVWKNGKLLSKALPGIAHCEKEFVIDNKKVLHHWSVFPYLHTQNGGVVLTLTLRQKTGGVEVSLTLPEGMTTTLGEETYSGWLVGEEAPDFTAYTCYSIFSPDATKLLVFGVHDSDEEGGRTASAFTLTLPTAPLTAGMDPLRMERVVQGTSVCMTTTSTVGNSVVPTTPQYTIDTNVDTTPVMHNNAYENMTAGTWGWAFTKSLTYATVTIETRTVTTTMYNRPTTRTSRERVDTVVVPTVDWSQDGALRFIYAETTCTNTKDYGIANWTETGNRKAGSVTVPVISASNPWADSYRYFAHANFSTEAAARAHVNSNSYTVQHVRYEYDPSARRFNYWLENTNYGTGAGLVKPAGDTVLADMLGDTDHIYWVGGAAGTWEAITALYMTSHTYNGGPQIYAVLHYLATSPVGDSGYSLLINGTISIPVWNVVANVYSGLSVGYTSKGPVTSASRTFLKVTNEKHAEASLAFNLDHCDFGVLNPPTEPYYVADQTTNIDTVLDSTTGILTDNSPGNTFNITCIPVNSVVALGDTRWPVSVLASVKPLMVVGDWRAYYVGQVSTGVRTEITFDEDDRPVKLNGATDAALDMMPPAYSYTTPTGKYLIDYESIKFSVETLATIPVMGGADWSHDAPASSCHGLEHWFKYDISPGPRTDQIMFGLSYENLSHPPTWGERPAVWTREKKYAAAVQGAYGDEVFYNSPIFTAIYKPEKL
jgi:hypothetical protein